MTALRRSPSGGSVSDRTLGCRVCRILARLGLAAAFLLLAWFLRGYADLLLDSDETSELMLGKLLAEKGGVLSRDWYYSNELRVLNTGLLSALFFRFTDSWHAVRLLTLYAAAALMLLAYLGYGKSVRGGRYFTALGIALLLPFSRDYFAFVLKGGYYLPHITITFVTLLLGEVFLRSEKRPWRTAALISAALLAIPAGMGGPRQLLILYLPLLLAALLPFLGKAAQEERRSLLFSALACLGGLIGYAVNMLVLPRYYSFTAWNFMSFTEPSLSRVWEVLRGMLDSFGYTEGPVFSRALPGNALSILWFGLTVYAAVYALRHRREVSGSFYRLALFFAAAVFCFLTLYLLTDMYYMPRYNLPVVILSVPLLAQFFAETNRKRATVQSLLAVLLVGLSLLGVLFFRAEAKQDATRELREIAGALEAEGYTEGYATFWNGNVLTELSNGAVEVWCWTPEEDDFAALKSPDDIFRWLQETRHSDRVPAGKLFVLLSWREKDLLPWGERLREDDALLRTDGYIVFGFDSHEAMLAALCPEQT